MPTGAITHSSSIRVAIDRRSWSSVTANSSGGSGSGGSSGSGGGGCKEGEERGGRITAVTRVGGSVLKAFAGGRGGDGVWKSVRERRRSTRVGGRTGSGRAEEALDLLEGKKKTFSSRAPAPPPPRARAPAAASAAPGSAALRTR